MRRRSRRPTFKQRLAEALRLRLVPLTILGAALLVGVKIGEVWDTASALFGVPEATAAQDSSAPGRKATGAPTRLTPQTSKAVAADAPPDPPAPPPAADPPQALPAKPVATAPSEPPKVAAQTPAGTDAAATAATPPAAAPPPLSESALPPPTTPKAAEPPAELPPPARDPSTFSKSELDVLQSLAKRRDELDRRAKEMDMREALLAATAKKVDERIAELKKIEAEVQSLVKEHDAQDEQSIRSLVKVYENMKPKDAARIFEQLDMTVLLRVAERMKEAKLAPVLADMEPAKAKSITIELANRRILPQKAAAGKG